MAVSLTQVFHASASLATPCHDRPRRWRIGPQRQISQPRGSRQAGSPHLIPGRPPSAYPDYAAPSRRGWCPLTGGQPASNPRPPAVRLPRLRGPEPTRLVPVGLLLARIRDHHKPAPAASHAAVGLLGKRRAVAVALRAPLGAVRDLRVGASEGLKPARKRAPVRFGCRALFGGACPWPGPALRGRSTRPGRG